MTAEPRSPASATERHQVGRHLAKGDRRRQQLIDALVDLFSDRSMSEISVAQIAAAAGVARSAFYFYFPSKHAALCAALTDAWHELDHATEGLGDVSSLTSRWAVCRLVSAIADAWWRHALLFTAVVDSLPSDHDLRRLWDARRQRVIDAVVAGLPTDRGTAADREALARTLVLMTESALDDQARRGTEHADRERALEALCTAWSALVLPARNEPEC